MPQAMKALKGVMMELQDCAFPTLHGMVPADNSDAGFADIDYLLAVGAKPRGPGMERADLMKDNAKIFQAQGRSLSNFAKPTVKALVVGNPANTNALVLAANAPKIDPRNITAMTRLDHNRAVGQLAERTKATNASIDKVTIWGNHSPTMAVDITHATIAGKSAVATVNDANWIETVFTPTVQKRGAAIIEARGASSAASAANAALEHIRDWALGTTSQSWTSMAVLSNGEYGVEKGIYSSFPVTCKNGVWTIVNGLSVNDNIQKKIDVTVKELKDERDMVKALC